jgi:predicted porin
MKSFLILFAIVLLTAFQASAQSNIEVLNTTTEVVLNNNVEQVKTDSNNEITGKKRDRLNAKINSKLKGEVDLFFVADEIEIC